MTETRKKLPRVAIGQSDFSRVKEEKVFFVDNTGLIQEIIDNPCQVKLLIGPRRLGKTFNLNMLKIFKR